MRFSEALNENIEEAGEVLAEARDEVSEAGRRFDQAIRSSRGEIDSFYLRMETEVKDLMRRPEPNWSTRYEEYPEPDEDPRAPPTIRTAEKYVIRRGEGTIGGLEMILEGIKAHLVLMFDFSEKFESERHELKGFKIGGDLKEAIGEEIEYQIPLNLSREQSFEVSPPAPVKDEPGISVYHEFEIEEVQYRRKDPAGWLHEQAPPTPVYLWFIGTTLHWAMWDVQIKLRESIIEEVFDYRNQTIPRPLFEGSESGFGYIHKPLAYRWELKKDKFSFTLVVLSLNSFEISYRNGGIV
ncbi:hypothetical protein AKJ45_03475 [candidate division MSBL1 archaeon SCGC-AAA261F19]|uniref:Uncharacterized protein n=2 Tax=candidate division MSBL1 TaxID=215777 RepID=A0A133V805_9EURY|nr:hypothetical protein AKJ43_03490 [candidate division MSBL1 archaeon SCGC-AAA261D19]KXB02573.1 hypothetical protein AKJ45_03475 [candidate division MSBL1 archaeon SCGC-AAA261F19]